VVLNGKISLFSDLPRLFLIKVHIGAFLILSSFMGWRVVSSEPCIVLRMVAPVSDFQLLSGEVLFHRPLLTIKYEEKSFDVDLAYDR
jgi:hypothetical protein